MHSDGGVWEPVELLRLTLSLAALDCDHIKSPEVLHILYIYRESSESCSELSINLSNCLLIISKAKSC